VSVYATHVTPRHYSLLPSSFTLAPLLTLTITVTQNRTQSVNEHFTVPHLHYGVQIIAVLLVHAKSITVKQCISIVSALTVKYAHFLTHTTVVNKCQLPKDGERWATNMKDGRQI